MVIVYQLPYNGRIWITQEVKSSQRNAKEGTCMAQVNKKHCCSLIVDKRDKEGIIKIKMTAISVI